MVSAEQSVWCMVYWKLFVPGRMQYLLKLVERENLVLHAPGPGPAQCRSDGHPYDSDVILQGTNMYYTAPCISDLLTSPLHNPDCDRCITEWHIGSQEGSHTAALANARLSLGAT